MTQLTDYMKQTIAHERKLADELAVVLADAVEAELCESSRAWISVAQEALAKHQAARGEHG